MEHVLAHRLGTCYVVWAACRLYRRATASQHGRAKNSSPVLMSSVALVEETKSVNGAKLDGLLLTTKLLLN